MILRNERVRCVEGICMSHQVRPQFALYRGRNVEPDSVAPPPLFLSPHDSAICPYSSRGS
jgi:hypothetical protein